MKRLFIAIEIAKIEKLTGLLLPLKNLEKGINWVNLNDLHLTLAFLGDTGDGLIPALKTSLAEVCKKFEPFEISAKGIGTFGNKQNPHVLWLGISESNNLKLLHYEIGENLKNLGLKIEEREFKPHVTLGRIKKIENITNIQNLVANNRETNFETSIVKSIILFESKLTPLGPNYTKLHTATLN